MAKLRVAEEELAITHPAERDAIAEVESARILLVDQLALKAVLRIHQQLRVTRNLECFERRTSGIRRGLRR